MTITSVNILGHFFSAIVCRGGGAGGSNIWILFVDFSAIIYKGDKIYRNNPKYWDTLSSYHTCRKVWHSSFYYVLMCLKYCWMYGKQCRPWSDAAFCGIWSGATLFTKVHLSHYLGLLWYTKEYTFQNRLLFRSEAKASYYIVTSWKCVSCHLNNIKLYPA